MKKFMTAAAVLTISATLAIASPGDAHGKKGHGKAGAHPGATMSDGFAEKLGLTEAQRSEIDAIRQASRAENEAFFEAARATRMELKAAKDARDTAKIEALSATAAAQKAKMKELRTAERAKISAILSPEQKAKLDAFESEFKDRRGARRHHKDRKPGEVKPQAKPVAPVTGTSQG